MENEKLDEYIEKLKDVDDTERREILMQIIKLVKSVSDMAVDDFPIVAIVKKIIMENKELSELRDTLLPKLMSGELDVSDLDI